MGQESQCCHRWGSSSLIALLLALLALSSLARADEHDILTLNEDEPEHLRSYDPILIPNPVSLTVLGPPTLEQCQNDPYARTTQFHLEVERPITTKITITLEWPDPNTDYDLFVFDGSGDLAGQSFGSANPEVATLGGLTNGAQFACVYNFLGASEYTLHFAMETFELYQRPQLPTPTPRPASADPTSARETPPTRTSAPPTPEPGEVVRTPGPDGEPSEHRLSAVEAPWQADPPEGGMRGLQAGLIGVTVIGSAVGASAVALRIRRDLS